MYTYIYSLRHKVSLKIVVRQYLLNIWTPKTAMCRHLQEKVCLCIFNKSLMRLQSQVIIYSLFFFIITHFIKKSILIIVLGNYKDYTWFRNEIVPNNGQRRLIPSYAFSFVWSLRNIMLSVKKQSIKIIFRTLSSFHLVISLMHIYFSAITYFHSVK
jgi:hypothetical protein